MERINDLAVGIDLGTTYSCCHFFNNTTRKYECLLYLNGKGTIASTVNFKDKPVTVGIPDASACCEVKRLIGMKFSDEKIQNLLERHTFPFEIVEGEDGYAAVKLISPLTGEEEVLMPELVSAMVLKEIHIELMRNLKLSNDTQVKAIVTVPAYFTDEQKDRTKTAAQMSGFTLQRILSEPSSAIYAYGIENHPDGHYLAFDLGGGTFDITVLKKEANGKSLRFAVMDGHTHLGGVDFDINFLDVLLEKIEETEPHIARSLRIKQIDKPNIKKRKKERLYRLRKIVEQAKIELSTESEVELDLTAFIGDGDEHTYILTREEFEECNQSLFDEALSITEKALQKKRIDKKSIKEILLVGGSSRIPRIREMLEEKFPGVKINGDIDCDRVVSLGATRYANELMTGAIVEVKEVTTHVIKMRGEREIVPIIEEGVDIPHEHEMYIEVDDVEAYTELFEDDKSLDKFTLKGFPKNRDGTIVRVMVCIESDGTLLVKGEVNGNPIECRSSVTKKSQQADEILVDKEKINKYFEKN